MASKAFIHNHKQNAPTKEQIGLLQPYAPVKFNSIESKRLSLEGFNRKDSIILVPVFSEKSYNGNKCAWIKTCLNSDVDCASTAEDMSQNLSKEGSVLITSPPGYARTFLFVHVGHLQKDRSISIQQLKRLAETASFTLKNKRFTKLFTAISEVDVSKVNAFGDIKDKASVKEIISTFTQAFCRGLEDNRHVTNKTSRQLKTCVFVENEYNNKHMRACIEEALKNYNGERITRLFVDVRASTCTPEWSQQMLKQTAKIYGLDFKSYTGKELTKMGIGGLEDVGRGSQHESYMVVLHYKAPKEIRTGKNIVWVNKWISFDQGGLQNKPNSYEMWTDMAGGAAGLGAIISTAQKKTLKDDVYALFMICENMVSSNSMFPGDPIAYIANRDGQEHQLTVEVGHTDAEGRLVMQTGHAWAASNIKNIRLVMNIATLTGGALMVSGKKRFPFFASTAELTRGVTEACWLAGEEVSPQIADYSQVKLMKSDFADISNSYKGRGPSCMFGYLFMDRGVKTFYPDNTPHVHLDIAPTAYNKNPVKNRAEATGSGKTALEAISMAAERLCI